MKLIRNFLAGLLALALFSAPVAASCAITMHDNIGNYNNTSNVTTAPVRVINAVSSGDTILMTMALPASSAWAAADSGGNTYNLIANNCTYNTNHHLMLFWANATTALPAPGTATGSITTTAVTFTTDPGTLSVNQIITGTGVTADTFITGGISQWNGTTASATVNNSQTVVSETLTVSSGIKVTWTTGGKPAIAVASATGLAASPLDVTGPAVSCAAGNGVAATSTSNSAGSGPPATGTLAQAAEVVIGIEATTATQTIGSTATGFTALTGGGIGSSNDEVHWAYQIVNSTSTVSYAQGWTTSRAFGSNVWTFKDATATTTIPKLMLLGVGN